MMRVWVVVVVVTCSAMSGYILHLHTDRQIDEHDELNKPKNQIKAPSKQEQEQHACVRACASFPDERTFYMQQQDHGRGEKPISQLRTSFLQNQRCIDTGS